MKLTGNTIFITGGTSGIGLGLAAAFSKLGNKVIITGRSEVALKEIILKYPDLVPRVCDMSVESDLVATAQWLEKNHKVNVLINNAGIFLDIDLTQKNDLSRLEEEMKVNFIGPVKLVSLLLPLLQKEKDPAILLISSGFAYAPSSAWPLYCGTKAAIHSFSISLRHQLKKTSVKVIEILPPAVETRLTKELKTSKMPVDVFVKKTLRALEKRKTEIAIGQSGLLRYLVRISPSLMNYVLNRGGSSR